MELRTSEETFMKKARNDAPKNITIDFSSCCAAAAVYCYVRIQERRENRNERGIYCSICVISTKIPLKMIYISKSINIFVPEEIFLSMNSNKLDECV